MDDTYLACRPDVVASLVADPRRWAQWWPDLRVTTTRDRGVKGHQWTVEGALTGTAEIWLEPWWDGVVLHYYLRADPGRPTQHRVSTERRRRVQLWKSQVHRLKDELETGAPDGR